MVDLQWCYTTVVYMYLSVWNFRNTIKHKQYVSVWNFRKTIKHKQYELKQCAFIKPFLISRELP